MRILAALALALTVAAGAAQAQTSPTPERGTIVPDYYTQGAGDSTWIPQSYGLQANPDAPGTASSAMSSIGSGVNFHPLTATATPTDPTDTSCTSNCTATTPTSTSGTGTGHWIGSLDCSAINTGTCGQGGHGAAAAYFTQHWTCSTNSCNAIPATDPATGLPTVANGANCQTSMGNNGYMVGQCFLGLQDF